MALSGESFSSCSRHHSDSPAAEGPDQELFNENCRDGSGEWTNRPGPGVDPGEGGQTGEDVLSQVEDLEAVGQPGELPGLECLGEKIVRQVEGEEVGKVGDILSNLSYSVVGEVEMFNIGQQSHIGLLTEELSHHRVGHLDGLQIVESGKVFSLQTLDQTVRDLDPQHITGSR